MLVLSTQEDLRNGVPTKLIRLQIATSLGKLYGHPGAYRSAAPIQIAHVRSDGWAPQADNDSRGLAMPAILGDWHTACSPFWLFGHFDFGNINDVPIWRRTPTSDCCVRRRFPDVTPAQDRFRDSGLGPVIVHT